MLCRVSFFPLSRIGHSARRNTPETNVVVVTTPAAGYPGQAPPVAPPVYGTSQAMYATDGAGTTVYSHTTTATTAPVAVVVDPPKKSKKKRGACLFVCLFIIAFILCATLVPWPGTRYYWMYPNQQSLFAVNGLFIEGVETSTPSGYSPVRITAFSERPERVSYTPADLTLTEAPSLGVRTYERHIFLPWDEEVSVSVTGILNASCYYQLFVFRSEWRYDDFVNGYYTADVKHTTFNIDLESYWVRSTGDDVYYFVLYNNPDNGGCSNPNNLTMVVNPYPMQKYDTSTSSGFDWQCSDVNCNYDVPYGEYPYFVVEVPDSASQDVSFRSNVYWRPNSGAYVGLYVGLFGSLILCGVLAVVASKRKAKGQGDEESDPLLHVQRSSYVRVGCPPRAAVSGHCQMLMHPHEPLCAFALTAGPRTSAAAELRCRDGGARRRAIPSDAGAVPGVVEHMRRILDGEGCKFRDLILCLCTLRCL